MPSKSLYLKYRPIQLDDIVGQKPVVATLKKASLNNDFSHAYLFSGNYGCGKCIGGDSLVLLHNQFNKIKNIVPNNKGLSTINIMLKDETGYGSSFNGYYEKNVPTLKIRTRDGYNIEGTPEHPIRVISRRGDIIWKKLSNINKDDYCVIFRNPSLRINADDILIKWEFNIKDYISKYFGENKNMENRVSCQIVKHKIPSMFNAELARFFGYFVAEGHFSKNGKSISISNSDKNLIEDVRNIVKNQFGYDVKILDDKRSNVKNILISSVCIAQFLAFFGLDESSYSKHVPDIVLSSPKHIIREFLRAYFEGDGCVQKHRRSIGCDSVSKKLMQQVQVILLEFGIISTLHKKKSIVNRQRYTSWRISICSINVKLFTDNIGFLFDRKINESNQIQNRINGNTNLDVIPYLKKELNIVRKLLPVDKSGCIRTEKNIVRAPRWKSTLSNGNGRGRNLNLTYKNLIYLNNYFKFFLPYISKRDYNKIVKFISKIEFFIKANYFFSPVVSIEKSQCDVYDICKDGDDKSFIANGFINHNTSMARILAALINCENVQSGSVCGKCRACHSIHEGASMDVIELDGATNRGIDNIKALVEASRSSPQELKQKIYLVDEFHQLSKEAISALLKTLEEPPSYLTFILCTTDISKILPTILSRCQRFNFTKIQSKDIAQRLITIAKKESINIEPQACYSLAKMARGSMRDAIGSLEQIGTVAGGKSIADSGVIKYFGLADRLGIINIVKSILSDNIPLLMDQVNDLVMASVDCKEILREITEVFRNIMLMKAQNGNSNLIDLPDHEISELKKIGEPLKMIQLIKLAHLFSDVEKKINFNINERWITEATLINCVASLRNNNR